MRHKCLPVILAIGAVVPALSSSASVIKGKVAINDPAVISVIDFKGHVNPVNVNHLDSAYSLNIDAENPEIMTLFIIYNDEQGNKRQTYTPVLVGPELATIEMDIDAKTGTPVITTPDVNQQAFLSFTNFIVDNLRGGVKGQAKNISKKIDKQISKINKKVTNPLVKDYMELWGISTKMSAERFSRPRTKGGKPSRNQNASLPVSTEYLVNNSATKYFPEFVNYVTHELGQGHSLAEKINNLRSNLPAGDLLDYLETRQIVQFINLNKGKISAEEIISEIKPVAKDKPEYEGWKNAVRGYHSYVEPGDVAPEDLILDADGKEFRISDFKGKYLFIDFWASWCVYCVKEIPALEKIKDEFADSDIEFIGISLDDNTDNWKKALGKYNLSDNQYIVSSPDFAEKLRLNSIPRYMIYDRDGKLLTPNAPRPKQHDQLAELLKSLV